MKIQKKTMKKPLALLLGVTLILMLGRIIEATEYDPSYPWYLSGIFSAPKASSIACSPEMTHCLSIMYDDYTKRLRGFFVSNPKTNWGTWMPFANFEIAINLTYYDNYFPFYNFPFGVQYNKDDGFYYFWANRNIYVYYPINNTESLIHTITGGVCIAMFGQGTSNTGNVYYIADPNTGGTSAESPCNITRINMFTLQKTVLSSAVSNCLCDKSGVSGCSASAILHCQGVRYNKGYVGEKPDGNFQISGLVQWYDYNIPPSTRQSNYSINISGFPTPFSGIHYELNNDIYYAINGTANTTWGIYKVTSPDFSTYSGNALYYVFNSGIEEYIPRSIGAKTDVGVFYQHYRECNSTYGGYACPQIDNNNITFNQITFRTTKRNPVTGIEIATSAYIEATCNAIGYTTSGTTNSTTGLLTLGLPCTSNMTIKYVNTLLKPDVYTETFDFPAGCNSEYIKITYSESYIFRSIVTDGLTGLPIQGATVTLDSKTNTTNSEGKAFISDTYPWDSPTFISDWTNSTCTHGLTTTGTPHTYFYSVSKADYSSFTDSITLTNASSTFVTDTKRTVLYPNGIVVDVTAHTSDGFEVQPITALLNWSGNFYQSNLVQGSSYNPNQTSAGGLPTRFILFSNQTTYNLTANLFYNNRTHTKITAITNQTNENCIDGYCKVDFTLPYTFVTFPCFQNNDCVGGTCLGNIFYDLQGCKAGICNYKQQFCTSCDSRTGCYDIGTTEPCSGDQDCNKTCISPSSARYGYCSSTGNCVYKNINCKTQCINTTIPILSPNGTQIGNYSAGICSEHQICFSQGTSQALFQILKRYVKIGFIFNPLSVETNATLYLDQRVSCTPTEASETQRHCIIGVNVPKIESGSIPESNQIVTQVGGSLNTWQYEVNPYNNDYYRFFDISYQCNLNCEFDIQFCEYGCNEETGFCFQQPVGGGGIGISGCNQSILIPICSVVNSIVNTTTNQTLSQSLQASGYGFVLVFLTPIFWIFMAIIAVMIVASYYTRHMEIGAVAGLLLLVAFAMYFPELLWITILIVIIAGYIIGRQVVRAVRGD